MGHYFLDILYLVPIVLNPNIINLEGEAICPAFKLTLSFIAK